MASPLAGGDMGVGMMRAMPVMAAFTAIKKDYLDSLEGKEGEEWEKALHECHERAAPKALEIAKANGGIYNKAAQFVSSLQGGAGDHSVPKEFTSVLSELTDHVPPKPLEVIDEVFKEDFGKSATDLFKEFNPEPIAAASLAQVHIGMLHDGTRVAVKVQYPKLRENMAADFSVMETMASQIKPAGFDLSWLVADFKVSLAMELDFISEGKNTNTLRHVLKHRDRVVIPKVLWEFSSRRVLTMELITDMIKCHPPQLLKDNGFNPYEVGKLIASTFAEITLKYGVVHGDPHAGNVYLRKHPTLGGPQLVLLDHGLHHCVDKKTRHKLCDVIVSCLKRDKPRIKKTSEYFAGPLYRYFPLILSPWFIFGASLTAEDVHAAIHRKLPPDVTLEDVGNFLVGLHDHGTNMLGVLHAMGYTRGMLNEIDFPERHRLLAWAEFAVEGLDTDFEVQGAPSTAAQKAEMDKQLVQQAQTAGNKNTDENNESDKAGGSWKPAYPTFDVPTQHSLAVKWHVKCVQAQVYIIWMVLATFERFLPLVKRFPSLINVVNKLNFFVLGIVLFVFPVVLAFLMF
eukprot:TRINITY_DN49371_c0_g1_i1.p1 TRINITY_DN49371_c0_g1~~TRINITY_DN49371_c0_g1_i1.p1  ORF type:complete len:586 (+),score=56.79 TRINITY_DN49371_c0_g1_i1:51-1760(+)